MPDYGCTEGDCDARWTTDTPARRRGGFYRCPKCDAWRGVSLNQEPWDAYPDVEPEDGWCRAELMAALHDLRDDASPVEILRGLSSGARAWLTRHLSRRGWDIIGGVPVRRPGTGDPEWERESRRSAGGRSRHYGTSDEQFERTAGDGPMRVNGWGRRW